MIFSNVPRRLGGVEKCSSELPGTGALPRVTRRLKGKGLPKGQHFRGGRSSSWESPGVLCCHCAMLWAGQFFLIGSQSEYMLDGLAGLAMDCPWGLWLATSSAAQW